jgi:hypothetical protein
MKWAYLSAALILGLASAQANAAPRNADIVEGWYRHYLGRCAEPAGLRNWAHQLQATRSPDAVLAGILGSDEYYQRHGACPAGFVKGLYEDHLGRCPAPAEVDSWVSVLGRCHDRGKLALQFLCASKAELAQRR